MDLWDIVFILPNLTLNEPIEHESVSLVPHNNPRIKKYSKEFPLAKHLIRKFSDQFKRKQNVSIIIVKRDAPQTVNTEAIVGFRNAIAITFIIKGYEHSLKHPFNAYPLFSDYFDFYPITLSVDGNAFITRTPAVLAYDDSLKFNGQTAPSLSGFHIPTSISKEEMFSAILKAWNRRYVAGKTSEWSTRVLFRSFEMAYQAAAMPFRNNSTIYDYGSSISLWVSAFEILTHPRKGYAGLKTVLHLLRQYEWSDKKIRQKRYQIKYQRKKEQVTLVEKLYFQIYQARNDFLHGNPVKLKNLYPFQNDQRKPLTAFAPLIYKVALYSFLNQFRDQRKCKGTEQIISRHLHEWNLVEALLKAKN